MPPLYILYRFVCLTFTTGKIITGIRSLGDNLSENSAPFNTVVGETSGYATMVHGRGCSPHRSTTTFAKPEMTSLMTS